MGGHYGSIHARTDDRKQLLAIATTFAEAEGIKILVGPAVQGWVGLYPEGHGQDARVSRQLAEQFAGPLLHLLVHDDDIFAYWFYRDGKLIDSFHSKPGYFGEENRAAEERMAGNPETFRPLVGEKIEQLKPLLARGDDDPIFASELLTRFSKVLGIPNALHAYEYLKEGERTGLKGWRQFAEVPQSLLANESAKILSEKLALREERRLLISRGILLFHEERAAAIPYCCALNDSLFAAWPDFVKQSLVLAEYRHPWKEPLSIALDVPNHVTQVASDAKAKRVAIAAGKKVCVFERAQDKFTSVHDISESDLAIGVAISADGTRVAHASRLEIVVTDLLSGQQIAAFKSHGHSALAFHPDGNTVAAAGSTLGVIQLNGSPTWTDLFVGGQSNADKIIAALTQPKLASMDFDEIKKKQLAGLKQAMAKIESMVAKSKEKITDEQLQAMRRSMQEQSEQIVARLAQMKSGNLPAQPPRANERTNCVGFSRDGKWMWCGADGGFRVYEWAALHRPDGLQLPPPTWTFKDTELPHAQTFHAAIEEVDAAAVVFASVSGRLFRMDLTTGETRELLKLPGHRMIFKMALTADGQALGVGSQSAPTAGRRNENRQNWDIFAYPTLRGPFMRELS